MPFQLKPLPFAPDSLGPTMSARTLEFHHGKHHATYVNKLNEFIAGTDLANKTLEQIITATAANPQQKKIFNNAAQVWNHDFFWDSIAPNGGGTAPEPILARLNSTFGSFDTFRDKFVDAAVGQFGSGWAWLVVKGGKLEIITTHDAEVPFTSGAHALATCDVWEHAYYLDYQNNRAEFVRQFIGKLINWQHVSKRLSEAGAA
jgi:Fe-Mn family superoxide dismutase